MLPGRWQGLTVEMFFFPGQFFRPLAFKVSDFNPGNEPSKIHATMLVKQHRLAVTR